MRVRVRVCVCVCSFACVIITSCVYVWPVLLCLVDMMSPITVRADIGEISDVSGITEEPAKPAILANETPTEMKLSNHRTRSGAVKLDAAFQVHF